MHEVEAGRTGLRMDFWSMKMSWTQRKTTAYEVKVSRKDFMRDAKWQEYLPYCERFYFVCPWGMIQAHEIHVSAGLLWVDEEGVLHVQKSAKKRAIEDGNLLKMLQRACFKLHFKEN